MDAWMRLRRQRLNARARELVAETKSLAAMKASTLQGVNAMLGGKLDHVVMHLADPDLMQQRLADYTPITGAEHCPTCWMKHGDHAALYLEQQYEGVDLLTCPRCNFSEFVMSVQHESAHATFATHDCHAAS